VLLALAVAPYGGVTASAARAPSAATAQVVLGEPAVPVTQGLVRLVTVTLSLGYDPAPEPDWADVSASLADAAAGPEAVFDEALVRVAEAGSVPQDPGAPAPAPAPAPAAVSLGVGTAWAESVPAVVLALGEALGLDANPGPGPGPNDRPAAREASVGWVAGMAAFGVLALACLRRYRTGRWVTASRGRAPGAAAGGPPGRPLGRATAAGTRRDRRTASTVVRRAV
jgi:hypothetical protein